MFKLDSQQAVLDAFRPKDRKLVELPAGFTVPVAVRDYLAWQHPGGGRVYLIFSVKGGVPTGIVFDTNGDGVSTVPHMCDWCHCTGLGNEVGLLTAQLNAKKRVGANVCSDLSCKQKLEDQANRMGYSPLPAIERVVERMAKFARDALEIDLSGAGR